MRYPRHAFAPGCATKGWWVLLRKGYPKRTETLSREWWPMNDESLIRLRTRKSKHGSVSEPAPQLQKHLAARLRHNFKQWASRCSSVSLPTIPSALWNVAAMRRQGNAAGAARVPDHSPRRTSPSPPPDCPFENKRLSCLCLESLASLV